MLIIISLFILTSYIYSAFKLKEIWITSEITALLTYILWVFVWLGHNKFAIIFSIVLVLIISLKETFEKVISSISKEEFMHSLKFAVIAFVILPLLPDEKYSIIQLLSFAWMDLSSFSHKILTMAFFNPYSIWFFVVVISAVGYVWYILSKFLWKNSSVILSSVVGWLVSSTAVTATMSEQSKKDPSNPFIYVMGVLLANSVMLIRVVVIVLLFNISLLSSIWLPSLLMLFAFLIFIIISYLKSKDLVKTTQISSEDKMKSPFSIVPALKFWLFILFIKFIAWIGLVYKDSIGGDYFYYVLGLISWFADVDAITQTMSLQAKEWLVLGSLAVSTILIAVMSNNIVKSTIAFKFWDKKFWKIVASAFLCSIVFWIIWIIY